MRKQDCENFEVILVDNGSEDGSTDYVREVYPEVQVIALKENTGFAQRSIQALRSAQAAM